MGVDATHYVMIGIRLPYKHFPEEFSESEQYEAMHDNAYNDDFSEGVSIVTDGMNGKYAVVGRVIEKGVSDHGNGIDMTEIVGKALRNPKLIREIREALGEYAPETIQLSAICFTHYH